MLLAFGSSLPLHTTNEYDVPPSWPSFHRKLGDFGATYRL
jgi:hypothetical protein